MEILTAIEAGQYYINGEKIVLTPIVALEVKQLGASLRRRCEELIPAYYIYFKMITKIAKFGCGC